MGTEKTFINLAKCANISLKDCGISNPTVEGSTRNLALVSMMGKTVTVSLEIHVELVPKRVQVVGKDNCFPKLVMTIPKGTVIGPWTLQRARALEFKHWAKKSPQGVYLGESYPEALKERELDMTALNEKLFPPSDLTVKAVKTDATASDSDKAIARKVMEKIGNDMDKFLAAAKVAELLGWGYVYEHLKG